MKDSPSRSTITLEVKKDRSRREILTQELRSRLTELTDYHVQAIVEINGGDRTPNIRVDMTMSQSYRFGIRTQPGLE